jgi:hypothetical protein
MKTHSCGNNIKITSQLQGVLLQLAETSLGILLLLCLLIMGYLFA